jgi:signal transduction histidine kinase
VVRHSGATEVRIGIRCDGGRLQLRITDNGHGFPPDAPTAGMDGIANMRARIEKLGGHFDLTSPAGGGTTVRFDVPLEF